MARSCVEQGEGSKGIVHSTTHRYVDQGFGNILWSI